MMFRDDLYQAERRIARAEQELGQARADRDHLARSESPREIAVPEQRPRRPAAIRHHVDLLHWWPFAAIPVLAIVWLASWASVPDLDSWADFPLGWVLGSAIAGSALYAIDVLLRWTRGDRTVLNRLLVVLAYIAGAPALLMAFLVFGGIMGYVGPIVAVIAVIGCVINWIVRG